MKVAAVQHDVVWEDREATLARLEPMVAEAAQGGADLVVLAEMFAVGFTMSTAKVAEEPGGPTETWMRSQADQRGLWICGSVPTAEPSDHDPRPTNRLLLVSPTGEVHHVDKRHPFTYAGEHEHYRPGTNELTAEVHGTRITPAVCYDLRFSDLFWARAEQTDVYVVPANWPRDRSHHWRSLLIARAIENQAYVVGVNRVGEGDGLHYRGDSMIVDPMGEVLSSAVDDEAVLLADIDADVVADVRRRFPFLPDR